ncbi:Tripartite-type tricarboxylate transporter, receptor component TctC [Roseomonas rosea]|uniref:Tripartite-type tricarboxylate transporter, receptor component TctC n=1 Tax=Muricoccus roseus TaxID=198092 RepID=A0A1M6PA17_9PROT|nr:tripartite tricarboxylate transporter substrate binding protein [Roseomonas rosea]SHK04784.1 Tripartite-type tricarboxylate transporter, receptor component TctC [Roseomonas rosea]
MNRRQFGAGAVAAGLAGWAAPRPARAQPEWPARPIRLIIPYPPAGGTDVISREMANRIGMGTGWNIIPENRSGAGGNIGIDLVSKAPADGYTIGMGQCANLAINVTLYPSIPYQPLRDLSFISLVAVQPNVIVVSKASPFRTLAEFVAGAKAKPGGLTIGHSGSGTVGHLSSEVFNIRAGIETVIVPYRGAAPVVTDLLGGRVDCFHANPLAVRGMLDTGELRPLAVTSPRRMDLLPEVPTVAESGYPGFEAMNWTGLVAPANTPAAVIARLNEETQKALTRPEVVARLAAEGSVPNPSTPEEFRRFCAAEIEKWGRVVRDARVQVE